VTARAGMMLSLGPPALAVMLRSPPPLSLAAFSRLLSQPFINGFLCPGDVPAAQVEMLGEIATIFQLTDPLAGKWNALFGLELVVSECTHWLLPPFGHSVKVHNTD